ncbi:MAG: aminotransferase class I/II-fold pyridoxal phosphate-dependent enzyme [Planctomycetota bacterium]
MERDLWLGRLNESLDDLRRRHLRRERREVARAEILTNEPGSADRSLSVTECLIEGRRCLSFATNDYLGLTCHPDVVSAFQGAASRQIGSGASPLIAGRSPEMLQLESCIAGFEEEEAALVFPTGYAANFGTLTALISDRDAVFCDRDNHASLIDGCRAGSGKFFVYDRSDPAALRASIHRRRSEYESVFIVTDSVFSMDGSVADLSQLCELAEGLRCLVVVDEAHGTGVFGTHGRGVCELQNVERQVAVRIGTLSKAVGCFGGFVAGPQVLCDWLWNRARSQFFSTALPPAVCAAAGAAFRVIQHDPQRRLRLAKRSQFFRQLLRSEGLEVFLAPEDSPIVGVMMADDARAVRVSAALLEAGTFAPAVRPPTVPQGTSRLRFSVSSEHSEAQLERAVYQLRDVLQSVP